MDDEWHVVKKPSNIPSDAIISLVSLRRSDISFNCHFSKHAELKKYRYVTFYVMPNKYKIGFKFHNDPTDPNANKLLEARIVADGRLHSGHPWLKAITKIDDDRLRRFEPKKMLTGFGKPKCAQFLKKVKKIFHTFHWMEKGSINIDARGKSFILAEAILERASAPDRKEWEFDAIEYSVVEDEADQERWESYWVDQYFKDHARKPLYN